MFRPPSTDSLHASLYLPGRDGIFEIGLPPIMRELSDHELRSTIGRVFDSRNFEIGFGVSLLPEGLAGREEIVRVRPTSLGFAAVDMMKGFVQKLLNTLGKPIYGSSFML
jgi:hypothetical protein